MLREPFAFNQPKHRIYKEDFHYAQHELETGTERKRRQDH